MLWWYRINPLPVMQQISKNSKSSCKYHLILTSHPLMPDCGVSMGAVNFGLTTIRWNADSTKCTHVRATEINVQYILGTLILSFSIHYFIHYFPNNSLSTLSKINFNHAMNTFANNINRSNNVQVSFLMITECRLYL